MQHYTGCVGSIMSLVNCRSNMITIKMWKSKVHKCNSIRNWSGNTYAIIPFTSDASGSKSRPSNAARTETAFSRVSRLSFYFNGEFVSVAWHFRYRSSHVFPAFLPVRICLHLRPPPPSASRDAPPHPCRHAISIITLTSGKGRATRENRGCQSR